MNSSGNKPIVVINHLSAIFDNGNGGLRALEDISFSVCPQEFVSILGPSGSGKSTLLRILAGLLPPTRRTVLYQGEALNGPRRGIGFVFQRANLMPWRTVLENITLPLELLGIPRQTTLERAHELVN